MAETLYEMTSATQTLYEMLMNDEIDEQTFNDTVEGMGAIEKVEGYCQVISRMNAEAEMFKNEIDRLTKRKKSLENNANWLKGQLLNFYNANGGKKIKAGTFVVSTKKNAYVDISNESKIPKKYCTVKVSPNKTDIKKAIDSGIKVRGASIQERVSVIIR